MAISETRSAKDPDGRLKMPQTHQSTGGTLFHILGLSKSND